MKSLIKYIYEALFSSASEFNKADNDEQDFVDLGLESGVLWGTCNLGANNPKDPGLYFMWGYTDGYKPSDCKPNNCYHKHIKVYGGHDKYSDIRYSMLEKSDDAACKMLGDDYRIPGSWDFSELIKGTDVKETKDGFIFKSKVNDNYIFIPRCGGVDEDGQFVCEDRMQIWAVDYYGRYNEASVLTGSDINNLGISSGSPAVYSPIRPILKK